MGGRNASPCTHAGGKHRFGGGADLEPRSVSDSRESSRFSELSVLRLSDASAHVFPSSWETARPRARRHRQPWSLYVQSPRSQAPDTSHPAPHSASRSLPPAPGARASLHALHLQILPRMSHPPPKPMTNHTPRPPSPEDAHPTCDWAGRGLHPDTYLTTYHSIEQLFVPTAE